MMDAKRRKISQENRMFQPQWTNSYFFILPSHKNAKPTCLICSETVAVNKTENVKRHFQSKHKKFETDYPNGSQIRSDKISSLIVMYERSKSLLKHSLTEQEKCLEASFRISWVLAKNMAPFQHSEMVKECMIEASGALFDNKKEIIESFKKIPLSNNTATRRVETCSQSIHDALYADLQKTEFFSLAIDESTDITDIAQMSVFVQFLSDNKFTEELLAILPLKDRTTGEMLFNSFQDFMNVNNLSFAKILSLTTDGALAMTGKINGFVALAKNKNPNILGFHCIIHQSVLCAKLSGEFKKTMDTVMKIVNHLRSHSSLQHRLLRSFLQECNADYPDLLAYNNVRWLSKGNVLKRVFALLPEIREFLQNRNTKVAAEYFEFLSGEENVSMIAFMADMFSHFYGRYVFTL